MDVEFLHGWHCRGKVHATFMANNSRTTAMKLVAGKFSRISPRAASPYIWYALTLNSR